MHVHICVCLIHVNIYVFELMLIFMNNFPKFRNTTFQDSIAVVANYHLSTLLLHQTIHSPNPYLNFYRTN